MNNRRPSAEPGSGTESPGRCVIVIGAGIGGLAAAILLARKGWRVTLLEQNSTPGGKMQEVRESGFRFDTGPSLLTLPGLLTDLIGDDMPETLAPEPLCRYFYPDGSRFDCHQDPEQTAREAERLGRGEGDAYLRFLDHAETLFQRTEQAFLKNPLYDLADLKGVNLADLLRIDATTTVARQVDRMVRTPQLRQFFKRFTTYNGSSPYKAPGTLNVIPHVELTLGGHYVRGGLYRIAEALEKCALKEGVEIRYRTKVTRIRVEDGRVRGIRTADGEEVHASAVLSNSDATHTILSLLEEQDLPRWKRHLQKRIEPSSSGFVLLLGCSRTWDFLSHHNIFFSRDYREEFRQIFDERTPPSDPTVYVTNTSLSSPADAPEGSSNLFVLVNVPWLDGSVAWDSLAGSYGDRLIDKLEKAGLTGLKDSIRVRRTITPEDFLRRYSSNRGSIYGTSSNGRFSAFLRPRNKLRGIEGLYLAGGSTHPGGGIPLVIQSARNAVDLMDRYESG